MTLRSKVAEHLEKHVTLLSLPVGSMDMDLRGEFVKSRAHIFWMKAANTTHRLSAIYFLTGMWKLSRLPIAHRDLCS
jgi:hypothetical protein